MNELKLIRNLEWQVIDVAIAARKYGSGVKIPRDLLARELRRLRAEGQPNNILRGLVTSLCRHNDIASKAI